MRLENIEAFRNRNPAEEKRIREKMFALDPQRVKRYRVN
jgi:hypothetical protein